jgi:TonB family protein
LRSIAAVPIRSRLETIGILEVFSTSAHAFTEEHMTQLSSLAELADAVNSPKIAGSAFQTEVDTSPALEPIAQPDLPILNSPWTYSEKSPKLIWRYFAGVGAVLLLGLFLFASWRMLRELKSRNSTQSTAAQPAATPTTNNEALTASPSSLPAKPTPEQIALAQPATNSSKSRGVIQAANIESEPDDGLIRNIPVDSPTVSKVDNSVRTSKTTDAETSAPPQVSMVSTNEDSLRGILAPASAMPQLEHQHSQGATPLVLERKVMPSYPRQALTLRHEGPVVTRATVSETGQVLQVKVLSGDPILARAAIDAIRQWHYHPALLNGIPTESEIDITLNFKLP